MSRRFDACSLSVASTLFTMAVVLAAASGCSADRFQSVGCVADSECRSDRVCSRSRCVPLEQADREAREDEENPDEENPDEENPDAGQDVLPDTPPDDETDDETEEAISQFVGSWRTEVNATMTSSDGDAAPPPIPSTLIVDISRGEDADLLVEIDFSFICPLEAEIDLYGAVFNVTTRECQTGSDAMSLTFWNIAGQGRLAADGDLIFDFSSNAAYGTSNDAQDFLLEMTLKGPRID